MSAFFIFTKLYRLKKIFLFISNCYKLDYRALAIMRIGIAGIIITDILIRGSDLTAHYTNEGLWPTNLVHNFGWKTGNWSIHELSGSYYWAFTIFSVHIILALCLLIGFKTRLITPLLWLLTISLHNRNLFVQQAGDDLLRLVLFWGIFLPWNLFYAIDAKKNKVTVKQNVLANLGYLFLISSVYFFTVNLKNSNEWRQDGTAIYYALSLEQIRLPIGNILYEFPFIMKLLTWFVFLIELLIPLLILLPSKNGKLRWAAFICILILHIGIGLTLYVGLFFIINIVTAIALIPESVINKTQSKLNITPRENSILIPKKTAIKQLTNYICILVIIICMAVNLSTVKWFNYTLKNEMWIPVNMFRFDQYWGMFSPSILKKDGWFVYHGMDSIGRQWDLYRNNEYVEYKKPKHIVKMYKNDRWRKLAENMQNDNYTFLRPLFCRYIIKKWNVEHPDKKMNMLNLYFMEKQNLANYKTSKVTKKLFCVCNDN